MTKKLHWVLGIAFMGFSFGIGAGAQQANLIPNPSLEEGGSTPQWWARGRWGINQAVFSYPVPGFDGAKAARVSITSYSSGDAKWYFAHIPVTPGQTYEFSDYYQATVPSYITLQYRMADGTFRYPDIAISLPPSSSWTQVQRTFTVPSGATSLTIFHLIKSVGSLTVDQYSLIGASAPPPASDQFPQGMVSLHFDDGWKTTYNNALPILKNAGLKGVFYVITGRFSFPAYINEAQVLDIQAEGHEIGAHTRTHVDLTTLPESGMRSEIIGSRDDLRAIGVTNVSTFAYPFGSFNALTDRIAREAFSGIRTSDGGFNQKNGSRFFLKRQPVNLDTTISQVQTWIDDAIRQKYWLILVFHRVDSSQTAYSTTPSNFQQIADYLKSRSVPVVTTIEGVQLMMP